jgi:hypothetical protein
MYMPYHVGSRGRPGEEEKKKAGIAKSSEEWFESHTCSGSFVPISMSLHPPTKGMVV